MTARAPSSWQLAVGVDIGGSKVLAVALDHRGDTLGRVRVPTATGAGGVIDSAGSAIRLLATNIGRAVEDFAVVGVGVPGLVQRDSGAVVHAVNLGVDGEGLRLRTELEQRLGVPVVVENDVNAAALGAAHTLGLTSDLALLSIGTGLAAGFVAGGRVRHGARGAAGEIGHVPVDPQGLPCRCGQRGCLETVASGSALAAAWPPDDGVSPARSLFAAAATGDPRALDVRDWFADQVASAVRLLVLTHDVETVVLGGGVTDVGPDLLDCVVAALARQAAGSPFLAALELPARVTMIPSSSAVAAVGAALCAAAGLTAAPDAGPGLAPPLRGATLR